MRRYLLLLVFVLIFGSAASAQETSSWAEAVNESYWFSYNNVTHLALFSGLGLESSDASQRWAMLLHQARVERPPWRNVHLNSAPFVSGSPYLTQKLNPADAATLRWDRAKMNSAVEPEALAWAVIAYVSWLRQIEQNCQRAPTPSSTHRLVAMTLGDLAAQALQFSEQKLTELYGASWQHQIAMLHALSAFALATVDSEFYLGELSSREARARADQLFENILKQTNPPWPSELRGQVLWLEALAWYSLIGSQPTAALQLLHRLAQQLQNTSLPQAPAAQALLVSALLTAHYLTGEPSYAQTAFPIWEKLKNSWEAATAYSVFDLGDLVGAFNAVLRVAGLEEAKEEYARFFERWLKRLQIAEDEESGSGRDSDSVPGIAEAGGVYGQAPVLATKIAYDGQRWQVLDGKFITAGALYTATRLLWLSGSCGEGFSGPPAFGLPQSAWVRLATVSERELTLPPPTPTAPAPTEPAPSTKEQEKILAELRAGLQSARERIDNLGQIVDGLSVRLQKAEQVIAELRHRPAETSAPALQQELQKTTGQISEIRSRVESIERSAQIPWFVWVALVLLITAGIWLYVRRRQMEQSWS